LQEEEKFGGKFFYYILLQKSICRIGPCLAESAPGVCVSGVLHSQSVFPSHSPSISLCLSLCGATLWMKFQQGMREWFTEF